jgi:hypothetical protein
VLPPYVTVPYRLALEPLVMRWRLILEEYGPELHCIKGESNVVADALSRLDMLADHPVSEEEVAEMFDADSDTGRMRPALLNLYPHLRGNILVVCSKWRFRRHF